MSENPNIQWALDILQPDPAIQPTIFEKYGLEAAAISMGLFTGCLHNMSLRNKTLFTDLRMHIGFSAVMLVAAQFVKKRNQRLWVEKESVYRHYVKTHPEDFPPPVRKKLGEVFDIWFRAR